MGADGTGPSRWRRVLAWALLLGGVCAAAAAAAHQRRDPRERLEAVMRFNRRRLNPLMLRAAGREHWYAARLEHVGRKSGRRYATPVVARPVAGGFTIPLPYGRGVDWLRNLEAAGRGDLVAAGCRYAVTEPRVVPGAEVADQLSPLYRGLARRDPAAPWLLLAAEPVPRCAGRRQTPADTGISGPGRG